MDTQNFGRYDMIPSPLFVAGHNNEGVIMKALCIEKPYCHELKSAYLHPKSGGGVG